MIRMKGTLVFEFDSDEEMDAIVGSIREDDGMRITKQHPQKRRVTVEVTQASALDAIP